MRRWAGGEAEGRGGEEAGSGEGDGEGGGVGVGAAGWGVCVGVCGCVWVCVGMCGCVWYWTIPQVNSPRLHMAQAVLMIFSVLAR